MEKKSEMDIAVVIPYYQKEKGLLASALSSVFNQTVSGRLVVVLVDDGSPYPARKELDGIRNLPLEQVVLIEQANGGAGSARNKALDNLPEGIQYVAFLDSDDEWLEKHIENGLLSLENGADAYFSDHYSAVFPDESNFERIGTLDLEQHAPIDKGKNLYSMSISMIEHIVSDGGGVIGTSNVIYNYLKYPKLRFREEFYNGQDFFFWMDLSDLGATWGFSTELECRCGQGINIYSGSGWGSEKSLQRLRNEFFIWTSVERFYSLNSRLLIANQKTISTLKENVVRDILHRFLRKKPISLTLIKDIFSMCPSVLASFFFMPVRLVKEKMLSKY